MRELAQRLGARALSAIPEDWIATLAGRRPAIRGCALDAHAAVVLRAGRSPALHTLSPAEARAATDASLALAATPLRALERIEEHRLPGTSQLPLAARLHVPPDLDGPRPLVLYFHQGGFVIGNLDWCEAFCGALACGARCPVLSVDYRKGPEHRAPAAQEDAWSAYRFALERASVFGGDPTRIGVAGDSAGGGLAAHVAQRARAENTPLAFQLLLYPWLVPYADNASYRDFADQPPLVRDDIPWFLSHCLAEASQRSDARLWPGLATDLAGLAPALVYTAGFDILRDEGEDYAQRLAAANVPVTYRCYESLPHAFNVLGGVVPAAARALDQIAHEVDLVLSRGVR